jgi:hypothetical protein
MVISMERIAVERMNRMNHKLTRRAGGGRVFSLFPHFFEDLEFRVSSRA